MVKKQKTIPQLEAEKAENERKISQLQHKKQQLDFGRAVSLFKGLRRKQRDCLAIVRLRKRKIFVGFAHNL